MTAKTQYDFDQLIKSHPPLTSFVIKAPNGHLTIDFSDLSGVKALNIALVKLKCRLDYYDISPEYLVPAVPGRWKYIEAIGQSFIREGANKLAKMHMLDIGVGANIIYPLLANKILLWRATGSDISKESLQHAQMILDKNHIDSNSIRLLHQIDETKVLDGILSPEEYYDVVTFNPPFYKSEEAHLANQIKSKKLGIAISRNFAGKEHEIACLGGELKIVKAYIKESKKYAYQVYKYSCLISKNKHLDPLISLLKEEQVTHYDTIDIDTKNKKTRILCWTFLSEKQAKAWRSYRWK